MSNILQKTTATDYTDWIKVTIILVATVFVNPYCTAQVYINCNTLLQSW